MPNKPDRVAEAGAWVLENGHRALLALTGGRFPRTVMGMLTVELHTVGRKSGRPYANLLTSPVHDDDQIVLVASKGGHSDNPDWYKNAIAHPDVTLVPKRTDLVASLLPRLKEGDIVITNELLTNDERLSKATRVWLLSVGDPHTPLRTVF